MRIVVWTFVAVAAATALTSARAAQGVADPAFDVASVKAIGRGQSPLPGPGNGMVAVAPGGRFTARAVTVRQLLRAAYGVEDVQIVEGPSWMSSDLFDVEATTRPDVTLDDARAMLRRLLRERFALSARNETRELPVFALEPVRDDRRLGPQLRQSGAECAPPTPPPNFPIVPPPPPPPQGMGRAMALTTMRPLTCPTLVTPWHLSLRAVTMEQLAAWLTTIAGRLVVDRTALTGNFDLELTYAPDPGVPPPMVNGAPLTIDAPALPAALRDQLGLRFENTRAPTPVVVIDGLEPPTQN